MIKEAINLYWITKSGMASEPWQAYMCSSCIVKHSVIPCDFALSA